jgi:hypothetical protein
MTRTLPLLQPKEYVYMPAWILVLIIIVALLVVIGLINVISLLPDIRRYIRMRSM